MNNRADPEAAAIIALFAGKAMKELKEGCREKRHQWGSSRIIPIYAIGDECKKATKSVASSNSYAIIKESLHTAFLKLVEAYSLNEAWEQERKKNGVD